MLLEGVHHQADGVFVRGRDVQNGEAGLGDALLVDLHALNDGPNRPAVRTQAEKYPYAGTRSPTRLAPVARTTPEP